MRDVGFGGPKMWDQGFEGPKINEGSGIEQKVYPCNPPPIIWLFEIQDYQQDYQHEFDHSKYGTNIRLPNHI